MRDKAPQNKMTYKTPPPNECVAVDVVAGNSLVANRRREIDVANRNADADGCLIGHGRAEQEKEQHAQILKTKTENNDGERRSPAITQGFDPTTAE